jgi:hypothetical protein
MSSIPKAYPQLHVRVGDTPVAVQSYTQDGLDLDITDAPLLRGFVMVFDGERLLSEAYIDAVDEARGFLHYVFGRNSALY